MGADNFFVMKKDNFFSRKMSSLGNFGGEFCFFIIKLGNFCNHSASLSAKTTDLRNLHGR